VDITPLLLLSDLLMRKEKKEREKSQGNIDQKIKSRR
jgi:hypothetical protein